MTPPALTALTREQRCELLAVADRTALVDLAERLLGDNDLGSAISVTMAPHTGSVVLQVREPVCNERFHLGDVVVTKAEVMVDGHVGWMMRAGSDRVAALAGALCDAIAETDRSEWADFRNEVLGLCERTAIRRDVARQEEWSAIAPTVVSFEELD